MAAIKYQCAGRTVPSEPLNPSRVIAARMMQAANMGPNIPTGILQSWGSLLKSGSLPAQVISWMCGQTAGAHQSCSSAIFTPDSLP